MKKVDEIIKEISNLDKEISEHETPFMNYGCGFSPDSRERELDIIKLKRDRRKILLEELAMKSIQKETRLTRWVSVFSAFIVAVCTLVMAGIQILNYIHN